MKTTLSSADCASKQIVAPSSKAKDRPSSGSSSSSSSPAELIVAPSSKAKDPPSSRSSSSPSSSAAAICAKTTGGYKLPKLKCNQRVYELSHERNVCVVGGIPGEELQERAEDLVAWFHKFAAKYDESNQPHFRGVEGKGYRLEFRRDESSEYELRLSVAPVAWYCWREKKEEFSREWKQELSQRLLAKADSVDERKITHRPDPGNQCQLAKANCDCWKCHDDESVCSKKQSCKALTDREKTCTEWHNIRQCTENIAIGDSSRSVKLCGWSPTLEIDRKPLGCSLGAGWFLCARSQGERDLLLCPTYEKHMTNLDLVSDRSFFDAVLEVEATLDRIDIRGTNVEGQQRKNVCYMALNFGLYESGESKGAKHCHGHCHIILDPEFMEFVDGKGKKEISSELVGLKNLQGCNRPPPDYELKDYEEILRFIEEEREKKRIKGVERRKRKREAEREVGEGGWKKAKR